MHPSFSANFAPSYLIKFLFVVYNLVVEKFNLKVACENRLLRTFANRDKSFYERAIISPTKRQKAIDRNGAYLT